MDHGDHRSRIAPCGTQRLAASRRSAPALLAALALAAALGPLAAAAPARAESAADAPAGARVRLDFRDARLVDVIRAMARITRKRFIWDEHAKGRITVVSDAPVPADEALRRFQAALEARGLALVEPSPGVLLIVPPRSALELPPPSAGPGPSAALPEEGFARKLIPLHHVRASALRSSVLQFVSRDGRLTVDAQSNSLIVSDRAANIRRVEEILSELDVPTSDERVEVIRLQRADANQVAARLREEFAAELSRPAAPVPPPAAAASAVPPAPGRAEPPAAAPAGGSSPAEIRAALAQQQRTPAPARPPPPAAAPEPAASVSVPERVRRPRFIADSATNALLVVVPAQDLGRVKELIALLDGERPAPGNLDVYRVKHVSAQDLAKSLSDLATAADGKPAASATPGSLQAPIQVAADSATNSLIIQSRPQDQQELRGVIEQLDVQAPQVLIEVLLLETRDAGRQAPSSRLLERALARSGASAAVASGSPVLLDNIVALPDAQGGWRTLPLIAALVESARGDEDAHIVSAPQILTADNEEARIAVGEVRGFPVSRLQPRRPSDRSWFPASDAAPSAVQIERHDVGVTLRVTPQISDDGSVRMKIFAELSDVADPDDAFGPLTRHRQVENTVSVKHGKCVLISGLTHEEQSGAASSLPGTGGLLGSSERRTAKTELMLLLAPRIVRAPAQ